MKKSKIIILVGFSCSGKDTLARLIEKEDYHFIISTTTRPMRDYETQDNPYHFIGKGNFLSKVDRSKFIEIREYRTLVNNTPEIWYYGVAKDDVSTIKSNVVVLDIMGLRDFKKEFGDDCISFFLASSVEERRTRNKLRGDYDETEFNRRLADDEKCFPQPVIEKEINYVIESSDPEENLKEILDILENLNV